MIRPNQIPREAVEALQEKLFPEPHGNRARALIAHVLNAWPGAEVFEDVWPGEKPFPVYTLPMETEK